MKQHKSALYVAMTAMILFWSITPVAISFVKNEFSLLFQIWLRYTVSIFSLWIILLSSPSLRKNFKIFALKPFYYLGRLSITAGFTILFQLLFTYCFFLISPAFGILLYQCQVLFSLLMGVIFFKEERMLLKQAKTILGILLALAGAVTVILFQKNGINYNLSVGILMAMGAALAWSSVGVSLRKGLEGQFHPVFTLTMVFTIVSIVLGPAVFIQGDVISGSPSAVHWLFLIASGLLGIAGGQGIYYYLLPKLGLVTAASVQLLVPFFTGISSFLLFGEKITALQILGGLILLFGCRMVLVQKSRLMT